MNAKELKKFVDEHEHNLKGLNCGARWKLQELLWVATEYLQSEIDSEEDETAKKAIVLARDVLSSANSKLDRMDSGEICEAKIGLWSR